MSFGVKTCVFDDCYLCHWKVRQRIVNENQIVIHDESWCGAARPEFFSGDACPMLLSKYEIEITHEDHPDIVDFRLALLPEPGKWLMDNYPDTTVDILSVGFDYQTGKNREWLVLTFSDLQGATMFKMRWFG